MYGQEAIFFFLKNQQSIITSWKIESNTAFQSLLLSGRDLLFAFILCKDLCDTFQVGIEAWKNALDSTGFTPEDYARLRGHYTYIHLVQRKINKRQAVGGHVVLDIPSNLSNSNINEKQNEGLSSSFEIGQTALRPPQRNCKLCSQKVVYGIASRSQLYRPAMLSMVAIAAVCVCVALLFKSCPEVLYVFRPFRWEMVDYGTS